MRYPERKSTRVHKDSANGIFRLRSLIIAQAAGQSLPRTCAAPPRPCARASIYGCATDAHILAPHETPKTGNKGDVPRRRACARALSPRSFLLLGRSLQLTAIPLCGLASWPLLGACSMYPGEQFLTFFSHPISLHRPPEHPNHQNT